MVLAHLPTGADGARELWKLNHYYVTSPTEDAPDEPSDIRWELHDLTGDPEERTNCAVPGNATPRSRAAFEALLDRLATQRDVKRLASRLLNPVT